MDNVEDLLIIGGGAAGYTAAIYAAREDFKPLVISGFQAGGQLMLTSTVENYPGFPDGIMGPDLMDLFRKQAERFGARFINDDVTDVDLTVKPFKVSVGSKEYYANCLIIALGASAKWLNIESEQRLIGKGVSSCATCDAPFFKNKDVVAVGGGDTACEDTLFLTKVCKKHHFDPSKGQTQGKQHNAAETYVKSQGKDNIQQRYRGGPRNREGYRGKNKESYNKRGINT